MKGVQSIGPRRLVVPALLASLMILAPLARAADYLIGVDDVLTISVYLHPELERANTVVDANGNVTFPPIGEVKAAGMTPKQLGDRIADRLSTYLRQTTAVTVTLSQYLSRSVYVSGAVAKPGRYGFEILPSVIEAIGQAGGATLGADLAHVQVVRREGEARRTLYADIASTLRDGDTSRLPALQPGDNIIVPGGLGTGQYVGPGTGAGVIGEVGKPGLYPVVEGLDVWTLLALAGGTTKASDLRNVRVVSREGAGVRVVRLDLKSVLNEGARSAYMVRDGDVVYVPQSTSSKFATTLAGVGTLAAITRDVFNILVLNELLKSTK
jgi:polysaccharide export outer membrane protein